MDISNLLISPKLGKYELRAYQDCKTFKPAEVQKSYGLKLKNTCTDILGSFW